MKRTLAYLLGAILLTSCSAPPAPSKTDACGPAPGTPCANWVCEDAVWTCEEVSNNTTRCDDPRIGTPCGADCGMGLYDCDEDNGVFCSGEVPGTVNECGGCESLDAAVGDPCATCGALTCSEEGTLVCVEPAAGCCEAPDGPCDEACDVSVWQCLDNEQTCNTDLCFTSTLATACASDNECESTNCANGFCSPVGYVYVPAGTFTMGAPLNEPGLHSDRENGQHDVVITRPMFVKETTVTQGEWEAMFGVNPSYFANCGADCPVDRINMFEMFLYANMLSEQEGLTQCYNLVGCEDRVQYLNGGCAPTTRAGLRCTNNVYYCDELPIEQDLACDGYRLATESEWEYFARAGTTTAFLTPDGTYTNWNPTYLDPGMDAVAWYTANSAVSYESGFNCLEPETRLDCAQFPPEISLGTHPVAQKEPNAWGLYDMTGNIWERVWDVKDTYPDPGTTVTDPTGPLVDAIGLDRAMRGGVFNGYAQYLRVAYRSGPNAYARNYSIGFRLVRSVIE